jgi:glutaryl-CoA dehydrogenase
MAAAPPYEELDFLDSFRDALSPDEKAIQLAVRAFVDRELMPIIAECFSAGRFPMELVPLFGENGFLGANCDGYGCQSLGSIGYGLLNLELERCDSGVRSFVSVQSALSIYR